MKIAEALSEKADLDKRIKQLLARIRNSARYTQDEGSVEDPAELLAQARALMEHRENLVRRINLTNAGVTFMHQHEMITVTQALALRERLNAERNLLNEAADAAMPERSMYGRRRTELPEKTDLPVRELRAEADKIARQHRELDALIQQSNWAADLI
jgi:hypothetical protein